MLLLPPIRWSQQPDLLTLQLPCPACDWIGLIAEHEETVSLIVRCNPAVFLIACAGYYADTGAVVSDWPSLSRWSETWLVQHIVGRMCTDNLPQVVQRPYNGPATSEVVAEWMKAKGNTKVRKPLIRFAACASGHSASCLKIDVPDWLPKRIALPRIGKRDTRGKPRRAPIAACWLFEEPPVESVNVGQLLRQKYQLLESESCFLDRLQREKLKAMKQLAYGASHEINNPLANIASRAQGLIVTEQDFSRKQKLATIYEQAMRAHEMISDMMLFANPPKMKIRETDLRLLVPLIVREVESSLAKHQAFRNKRIEFRATLGPKLRPVLVDRDQIAVLIHSLIRNSMEAIESIGSIELDARVNASGCTQIAIADDGVGVSLLAKEHLFDPFYSGREAGRGLGFGLSKAWRIAQLHNATLTLDEAHSPGARFVLSLPLGPGEMTAHNAVASDTPSNHAKNQSHAA